MNDLSDEARALLDGVEGAYEPTRDDRLRVRAGLAAVLPAAAAAGAGAGGAAVVKVVVFVVSAAVGSAAMIGGHSALHVTKPQPVPVVMVAPSPPPPPGPVVEPVVEPVLVEPAAPVEPEPVVTPPPPRRAAAKPKPVPVAVPLVAPAAAPAAATVKQGGCEASAELAVVQSAQRWLGSNPQEALRQLDAFEERCPDGALDEERTATRALALCAAGRHEEGRAQLLKLESRNRSSPALVRVREACGKP